MNLCMSVLKLQPIFDDDPYRHLHLYSIVILCMPFDRI